MIEFTVKGIPIPQGSMRSFVPRTCRVCGGGTRAIVTSDNPKLKQWRKTVRVEAIKAMGFEHPAGKRIPIRVEASFFLPRAKSNKSVDHVIKPDLGKLLRAIEDSMTGVVYEDDSQIAEAHIFKSYGDPRVEIRIEEVGICPVLLRPDTMKDEKFPF